MRIGSKQRLTLVLRPIIKLFKGGTYIRQIKRIRMQYACSLYGVKTTHLSFINNFLKNIFIYFSFFSVERDRIMLEKTALKEQNEELKLTVEVGLQAFLPGLGNRSRLFLAPWSRSRLRKKPGVGATKIVRLRLLMLKSRRKLNIELFF